MGEKGATRFSDGHWSTGQMRKVFAGDPASLASDNIFPKNKHQIHFPVEAITHGQKTDSQAFYNIHREVKMQQRHHYII